MAATLCIGIDPAPKKGAAIVEITTENGKLTPQWNPDVDPQVKVKYETLRQLIDKWRSLERGVLIAWDAPLTGPLSANAVGPDSESAFHIRPIEEALVKSRPPKGISVQPYSSCPHWTITRNLLGLPKIGPFDVELEKLHYQLLGPESIAEKRPRIVEVHPAVAIWFWLSPLDHLLTREHCQEGDFNYKANQQFRGIVVEKLIVAWKNIRGLDVIAEFAKSHKSDFVKSDDLLDAFVAAVLAGMFDSGHEAVRIYGDLERGAILLPKHPSFHF